MTRIMVRALLVSAALWASLNHLGARSSGAGFVETDLVVDKELANVPTLTDANGIVHVASFFDPHLLNPWGIATSATSPFWISDNGAGLSTLYNSAAVPQALVVSIPAPGDPLGSGGTPTGAVFNTAQPSFKISGVTRTGTPTSAPAIFLFATEDGTIVGWNPAVNPPGFDPAKAGTYGIIAVDNSDKPSASEGAVYKGLAIATDPAVGDKPFLYATNFRAGTVDVFDGAFTTVGGGNTFIDPQLPKGYAPFNIAALPVNGTVTLFVTYAVPDADRKDDVAGQSHGIVNTFDPGGQVALRFAQHGQLNSPWGIAVAPQSFGPIAGDILIGNFGNGHINVFAPDGRFVDKLRDDREKPIVIDGLWSLRVGNGGNGGDPNAVYFTAGPNDEADGLFGRIDRNR